VSACLRVCVSAWLRGCVAACVRNAVLKAAQRARAARSMQSLMGRAMMGNNAAKAFESQKYGGNVSTPPVQVSAVLCGGLTAHSDAVVE
jgi:hypothetical protein